MLKNKAFAKIITISLVLLLAIIGVCACGENFDVDYNGNGSSITTGNLPDEFSELKLIYQAKITVETEDYNKYVEELQMKIGEYGGYISSSSENTTETLKKGVLTIRVPSEKFNDMKAATALNGVVVNSSHEVIDVTENYTDIEGRLEALKAERDALNAMLAKAENVSTMLQIRSEINDLNIEIETYQRQLNKYDSQIAYSTITLTVKQNIDNDEGFGIVIFVLILFFLPETVLLIGIITFVIIFITKKKAKKKKASEMKA